MGEPRWIVEWCRLSLPKRRTFTSHDGTGAGGGGDASTSAGGTGGTAGLFEDLVGTVGSAGTLGMGGHGAISTFDEFWDDTQLGGFSGGGGGGGVYGGGGGGSGAFAYTVKAPLGFIWRVVGGGGGGGSSLGDSTQAGVHEGDGQVTVTPISGDCHVPTVVPVSTATTVAPKTTTTPAAPAAAVGAKPTYTG